MSLFLLFFFYWSLPLRKNIFDKVFCIWIRSTIKSWLCTYSGCTLHWCMTFVIKIMTFKHFWLFQCIWHQNRVTYPLCNANCSHRNYCKMSQNARDPKIYLFKDSLLFYEYKVEWMSWGVLWPYTMISGAFIGNTSWVCDPSLVSYAFEQLEIFKSYDYKHSYVMHQSSVCPLYNRQTNI